MARKSASKEIEIDHYIRRLDPGDVHTQRLLLKQAAEMDIAGATQCGCGKPINAVNSFRCVYCGQFLCVSCAEIHFGLTREDYDKA